MRAPFFPIGSLAICTRISCPSFNRSEINGVIPRLHVLHARSAATTFAVASTTSAATTIEAAFRRSVRVSRNRAVFLLLALFFALLPRQTRPPPTPTASPLPFEYSKSSTSWSWMSSSISATCGIQRLGIARPKLPGSLLPVPCLTSPESSCASCTASGVSSPSNVSCSSVLPSGATLGQHLLLAARTRERARASTKVLVAALPRSRSVQTSRLSDELRASLRRVLPVNAACGAYLLLVLGCFDLLFFFEFFLCCFFVDFDRRIVPHLRDLARRAQSRRSLRSAPLSCSLVLFAVRPPHVRRGRRPVSPPRAASGFTCSKAAATMSIASRSVSDSGLSAMASRELLSAELRRRSMRFDVAGCGRLRYFESDSPGRMIGW